MRTKRKPLVRLQNGRHRVETSLERFYRERAEATLGGRIAAETRRVQAEAEARERTRQIVRLLANDPTGALPEEVRTKVLTDLVDELRSAFGHELAKQAGHLFNGRYKPIRGKTAFRNRPELEGDDLEMSVTIPEITIRRVVWAARIS